MKRGRGIIAAGALFAGIVGVCLAMWPEQPATRDSGPQARSAIVRTPTFAVQEPERPRVQPAEDPRHRRFARAVREALSDAHAFGGTAQLAVWEEGFGEPIIEGDEVSASMRMWSLSKLTTVVAALEAARRRDPVGGPSPTLRAAITDAVQQSNNCAQRRVVLGLQELTGGISEARAAFRDVLSRAGVQASGNPQSGGRISDYCRRYLVQHAGVSNPLGPAALLGVQRWTIADMLLFGRALATERYGETGSALLAEMRRPKLPSAETPPGEFTAEPDWGAGQAFAPALPAYKAGWGGHDYVDGYVASQLVIIEQDNRTLVAAAAFHPDAQPPNDDPGKTEAPRALTMMFERLADAARGR